MAFSQRGVLRVGASRPSCLAKPLLARRTQVPRIVCNAYAAGSGGDPYQMLEIENTSDQNEINRAYTKKKAQYRGNHEMLMKIEAAHDQLVLNALNARLKGQMNVDKSIKYADHEPLFPWRPKRWDATPKVMLIVGAVQIALVASGLQQPSFSKVIACMIVGAVGNVMKQNAIYPPPEDPSMATDEEAGRAGRNFMRGALLTIMATFGGMFLASIPDYLTTSLNVTLAPPFDSASFLISFKVGCAAFCNWIMTAYYY